MEPQITSFEAILPFALADGVVARPLFGASGMLNHAVIAPGATVPLHDHPHEQLGMILVGSVDMTIAGVVHRLGPMDVFVIPGGVSHGAEAGPEGATVVDAFIPARDDYRERWEEQRAG